MLLGKQAPIFTAPAVIGGTIVEDFSLDQYLGKKSVLLFFYPADFSGLCPTEILAFGERLKDFEALDVQIVGCSVDSKFAHQKWLTTPVKDGGIEGVTYPLVSDHSMTISMDYDVLAGRYQHRCMCDNCDCKASEKSDCKCTSSHKGVEFVGVPMDYRATFFIDKTGKIRHQSINEFAMGRDVEEYLRLVEGIKLIDETGGACPANWKAKK